MGALNSSDVDYELYLLTQMQTDKASSAQFEIWDLGKDLQQHP